MHHFVVKFSSPQAARLLDDSAVFFVTEVSFHSVFKEIWLCPKIMVLPSGTSSQTPDLENFAMASRLRCQQNSSSSTVEFVDDTRMTSSGCLLQVG